MPENYYTYEPKMGLLFLTLLKFIVITVIVYKNYYFKNDILWPIESEKGHYALFLRDVDWIWQINNLSSLRSQILLII